MSAAFKTLLALNAFFAGLNFYLFVTNETLFSLFFAGVSFGGFVYMLFSIPNGGQYD